MNSHTSLFLGHMIYILVICQEKDEKLDGDAALNKFFRDIYLDADEDTKRAMSKSFVRTAIPFLMSSHVLSANSAVHIAETSLMHFVLVPNYHRLSQTGQCYRQTGKKWAARR